MAIVTYVPNPTAFGNEFKSRSGMVARDLNRRGNRLTQLAQRSVGKDTGRLRSSIHSSVFFSDGELGVRVGSNHRIALLHHQGTRPHEITPRTSGGVLRFSQRGRIVYRKRVFHPGTKPNPYLLRHLYAAAR